MNTNVKVIGLTRRGIKPESTAHETDALYSGIRLMNPRLINPAAYYIQFAWNGIVPILSRYKNFG